MISFNGFTECGQEENYIIKCAFHKNATMTCWSKWVSLCNETEENL